MSTSRLEALPAELLVLIAEYLFRRDLWACSVACKTLHAIILPLLYEKLYISSTRSFKLGQGLLNRTNPGLRYVRELYFYGWTPTRAESLRWLLLFLPEDRLRKIHATCLSSSDDGVFCTLLTRQKKLESISLGALPPNALAFVSSGLIENHAWASLSTLEIPSRIRSTGDLDVWRSAINGAQNLQNLTIRVCQSTVVPSDNVPLQDQGANSRGALFSTLFPALNATQNERQLERLVLRSLTLAYTCLTIAQSTIMSAVNFAKLVELRLEDCLCFDKLLNSLAKLFKASGSALRGFWLTTDVLYADEGLDRFLCSFNGLRKFYLRVTSDEFGGFDTSCLDTHRHSLEELAIRLPYTCTCGGEDRALREAASLLRVSTKLPRLRQLGLTVPLSICAEPEEQYADGIRSLLCHPPLQTLRIFNWPICTQTLPQVSLRAEYLDELGSFVEQIFVEPIVDICPDHRFPALFVGAAGECCYEDDHMDFDEAAYFKIGKYQGPDVFLQQKTVAARMTLKEVEGRVPEFNVVEFD